MGWTFNPETAILIVDDDPHIGAALRNLLAPKYTVFNANSVDDAHEFLLDLLFGLVIIDYDLRDEIDGIAFAEYVKTLSPLTNTIMLTGYSDFNLVKRALNEGNVDKFLIKPFDSGDLIETIDTFLAEFSSKLEISMMLKSSEGIAMAQSLLTQVFDETDPSTLSRRENELSAVVISKNSIPVYSKFIHKKYLRNFTDTIFSGFMTAIHMVGQEVFSDESIVDLIKFGTHTIYFQFYGKYQFTFILESSNSNSDLIDLEIYRDFVADIVERLKNDCNYFNAKNNYIPQINSDLEELVSKFSRQLVSE